MSDNLDRIKSKIEKLLTLAERASNEHEAANAMKKARALMDEYQLEAFDCEGHSINNKGPGFKAARASRAFGTVQRYISWLAVAVARFNDCQCVYESALVTRKKKAGDDLKMGKAFVFRGIAEDVDVAIDMFARLNGIVNGLCMDYMRKTYGDDVRYSMKIGGAFKSGAVLTINRLLAEEMERRRAMTTSTGTSLVVRKENMVAEYFGEVTYSKSSAKAHADPDAANAIRAGREAAKKVNVTALGINGKSEETKLIN